MTHLPWCLSTVALATAFVAPAHAQTSAATRPDPLDAKAAVPALVYRSALSTYRPYAEQAVGSWREANETVNRVGGWRTYAREAREPQPTAAPASVPKPAGSSQ